MAASTQSSLGSRLSPFVKEYNKAYKEIYTKTGRHAEMEIARDLTPHEYRLLRGQDPNAPSHPVLKFEYCIAITKAERKVLNQYRKHISSIGVNGASPEQRMVRELLEGEMRRFRRGAEERRRVEGLVEEPMAMLAVVQPDSVSKADIAKAMSVGEITIVEKAASGEREQKEGKVVKDTKDVAEDSWEIVDTEAEEDWEMV